jgi:hypothetical protein
MSSCLARPSPLASSSSSSSSSSRCRLRLRRGAALASSTVRGPPPTVSHQRHISSSRAVGVVVVTSTATRFLGTPTTPLDVMNTRGSSQSQTTPRRLVTTAATGGSDSGHGGGGSGEGSGDDAALEEGLITPAPAGSRRPGDRLSGDGDDDGDGDWVNLTTGLCTFPHEPYPPTPPPPPLYSLPSAAPRNLNI